MTTDRTSLKVRPVGCRADGHFTPASRLSGSQPWPETYNRDRQQGARLVGTCTQCGTHVSDDAHFCVTCGSRAVRADSPSGRVEVTGPSATASKASSSQAAFWERPLTVPLWLAALVGFGLLMTMTTTVVAVLSSGDDDVATNATVAPGGSDTTGGDLVDDALDRSGVPVVVANGSGVSGAAGAVTEQLVAAGYNPAAPIDTTVPISETALDTVYYATAPASFQAQAGQVATDLGLPSESVLEMPATPPSEIGLATVLVVVGSSPGGLAQLATAPDATPSSVAPVPSTSSTPIDFSSTCMDWIVADSEAKSSFGAIVDTSPDVALGLGDPEAWVGVFDDHCDAGSAETLQEILINLGYMAPVD